MSHGPETHADVVVTGGGPAGSAAAIWCARQGLKVILLERQQFPRHRPGETLPPAVDVLFEQLGVSGRIAQAGFARHPGTWVEWASARRFEPFGSDARGPWLGFQAPRHQLDQILLEAAIADGVEVWQSARAGDLILSDARPVGVVTDRGRIFAQWVIDASGGQHWLARRLDIPLRYASPRLTARYGYVRGECPACGDSPAIAADHDGWMWTAKIDQDLYHWTRLTLSGSAAHGHLPPPCFAQLAPVGPTRGADVTWRIVERPAGPGFICAGDAAAVLDPASSHGVLRALMSGMMAGHVIGASQRGEASPTLAASAYTTWLAGQFDADVAALTALYRTMPTPPRWLASDTSARAPGAG